MVLTASAIRLCAAVVRAVALCVVVVGVTASAPARAERVATRDALLRLGEALQPAVTDGALQGAVPLVFVGGTPAFEETRAWFPAAGLATLVDAFGAGSIRACEACMAPRLRLEEGRLEQNSSSVSVPEVIALDNQTRGVGAPARAAVWLDETTDGVAIRIVSLENSQILFAGNYSARLTDTARTTRNFNVTEDLNRRLRGESLTHILIDASLYPGAHISLDVVEQFGDKNLDLAGITMSVLDPVAGLGVAYYRIIPEAFNLTVGAQALVSVPTLLGSAISGEVTDVIDPLLTGVLVARMPIPATSFGALVMVSTNGTFGVGVSLLNTTLLPVLP